MKKSLKVKHYCSECYKILRHKSEDIKPLLTHQLILEVPMLFSIDDLRKQVIKNINQQQCVKHKTSKVFVSFSFYHEEKIQL